jgi:hypothetical protein
MAERKFKFVSPGVFINEIDNSEIPREPGAIGPLVIGRLPKGPAMTPVRVESFAEFVDVFGAPVPGGRSGDVWREGNMTSPTYAAYAAQAWLRNNPTLNVVRVLGEEDPNATENNGGLAGFKFGSISSTDTEGGAWGLFVWPSSSGHGDAVPNLTGTLAAIFYCVDDDTAGGRVILSGTTANGQQTQSRGCTLIKSDSNGEFIASITAGGSEVDKIRFNFNPNSDRFVRKVFNTDPTLANSAISTAKFPGTTTNINYFLGETFERHVNQTDFAELAITGAVQTAGTLIGAVMPLRNDQNTEQEQADQRQAASKASTGWFISQDLGSNTTGYKPENMQKLFRFEAISAGESTMREIKISITNITAPTSDFDPYGTFSVIVRRLSDNDNRPVVLERFDNLSLNPADKNYIAREIGDQFVEYQTSEGANRTYGNYPNKSRYIRVAMDEDVDRAVTNPEYLPFGVFGPVKYRDFAFASGSLSFGTLSNPGATSRHVMVDGGTQEAFGVVGGHLSKVAEHVISGSDTAQQLAVVMPSLPLKISSSDGSPNSPKNIYFGAYTGKSFSDNRFSTEVIDLLRARAQGLNDSKSPTTNLDIGAEPGAQGRNGGFIGQDTNAGSSPLQHMWCFSLDDVGPVSGSTDAAVYRRGKRAANFSFTAGAKVPTENGQNIVSASAASASYKRVLEKNYKQFTTCLHGGFDGLDISEREPFANRNIGTTEKSSYELHSLRRAINVVRDPEVAEFNIITIPGVTATGVTDYLLDVTEDRGDAIAIIDLEKVYEAQSENTKSYKDRNSFSISQAVDSLRERGINNSYGACYYPWVRIQDTVSGQALWAPPSVAALGAFSFNDRVRAPWYAPAGFARGGLSEGAGGVPVLDVSRRLTSDERDDLYAAGINPIAQFPAEGIVIFGQKTLQRTRSALDRINVRRLMVFLKKEISFIASRMLFDQNTQSTWNRFIGQAEPILRSVQSRFGLEEFRLILDESTTTPDLVDRNIIYAKILLKPTRTAEFFAIDFVITNTGASFAD